jgi:hypothetical protein
VRGWERAVAIFVGKNTGLAHLILVYRNLIPVTEVGRVRVARLAKVFKLVKILEYHEVVPASVLAEVLQLVVI